MEFPPLFWAKAVFFGALSGLLLGRLLIALPALCMGALALLLDYAGAARRRRVCSSVVISVMRLPALWALFSLALFSMLVNQGGLRLLEAQSGPLRWATLASMAPFVFWGLRLLPGRLKEYRRLTQEVGYAQKVRRTRLLGFP